MLMQARSHGGIWGQCPSKFRLCPPDFVAPRKICFKHIVKARIFPPLKMYCAPPNLQTWLRACADVHQDYGATGDWCNGCHLWSVRKHHDLFLRLLPLQTTASGCLVPGTFNVHCWSLKLPGIECANTKIRQLAMQFTNICHNVFKYLVYTPQKFTHILGQFVAHYAVVRYIVHSPKRSGARILHSWLHATLAIPQNVREAFSLGKNVVVEAFQLVHFRQEPLSRPRFGLCLKQLSLISIDIWRRCW